MKKIIICIIIVLMSILVIAKACIKKEELKSIMEIMDMKGDKIDDRMKEYEKYSKRNIGNEQDIQSYRKKGEKLESNIVNNRDLINNNEKEIEANFPEGDVLPNFPDKSISMKNNNEIRELKPNFPENFEIAP